MAELLLRMSLGATLGLVLVLVLRRPSRRVFGAGPAFTLWLLPIALMLAPLLPRQFAPMAVVVLPGLTVMPEAVNGLGSQSMAFDWPDVLVVLWLAGLTIALPRLAVHYVRLLRGLRAVPVTWMRMLERAAPGLDVRRVREHAAGPAVLWALPRSLILLPADFVARFDNDATRGLVLRHELTHVRRGDALWSLAMEIASALLWFHPLAWLARSRFRLDQELACDAASLRALPERSANYARALLDSVAVQPASALIPWHAEPQLKERIAMITRIPPGLLRRRTGFVIIAALLAGGLYVAGGRMSVAAATQTDSASTPPSVDITYKNRNPPHYPIEALHKGEQGEVLLVITVDATGRVTYVTVDPKRTNAPAILQTAAIQAADHWRFNPGMKNGHAVGGKITVPVTFSLNRWNPPHHSPCPGGFRYKPGNGKSYSCIAPSSAQTSS